MISQRKKRIPPGVRLRTLVVDDSVIIRRLVTHALGEDPHIEVVGSAANGVIALSRIPQLRPDVITLDIEMPEMDGLQTLREIRKLYPELIVVMFSTLSERGAAITIEALTLGANDYVTKVSNVGSLDRSMERLREELVPKLKQFFLFEEASGRVPTPTPAPVRRSTPTVGPARPKRPCRAVAIGVSTGGPNALAEVMPLFREPFPLPVFIVQHMPPIFTRMLAERLQSLTRLRVREASMGMHVEAGNIYIAPGDFHMRVVKEGAREVLKLDQAEPENSCRPAVDVMFRSVADIYGGAVVAAILTGMGQDGLRGIERLRAEGAYVIAQDEASSVVWGMPGAVVQAGLADSVVDLRSIVPEIQNRIVDTQSLNYKVS